MTADATFSLFVRNLPPNRGFLVAAGVKDCIDWLEQFSFEPADLDYLAGSGFDGETLDGFQRMRFSGDVWAVDRPT
jgi:nicotinate phosphoribosyltransferase